MKNTSTRKNRIGQTFGDNVVDVVFHIILIFLTILVAYPIIYIISASFSSTEAVMSGSVVFWPVEPSVLAYEVVLRNPNIGRGFINSLIYTTLGTAVILVVTMLTAFCLSRKDFYGKGVVSFLVIFTMFFHGGMIPTYLLVRNLGMLNSVWAMVLPNAMNAWFIILTRTYLQSSIPEELYESAELDGCSVFRTLWNITLPLSGPILAVIALFSAVGIWNGFFDAFLFLTRSHLQPLQIVLRDILLLHRMDATMVGDVRDLAMRQGLSFLLRYAVIVVSSVPLIMLYPFIQRYFIKGIMIGSLKG